MTLGRNKFSFACFSLYLRIQPFPLATSVGRSHATWGILTVFYLFYIVLFYLLYIVLHLAVTWDLVSLTPYF